MFDQSGEFYQQISLLKRMGLLKNATTNSEVDQISRGKIECNVDKGVIVYLAGKFKFKLDDFLLYENK